jgi:hypothetical protein
MRYLFVLYVSTGILSRSLRASDEAPPVFR